MQFDQLKWRESIPLLCGAATPSQPRTSAARQNVAAGSPHRRELLQSLLAAALATVPGWHNDAVAGTLPLARDRFVELSEKLCAMSVDDSSLADAIQNALESVRKHYLGLHSFRSMRRMEASLRKASALRLRHSQSLASLRHRPSQAKVRSTSQRLGRTTKRPA